MDDDTVKIMPWIEKYRPTNFEHIISHTEIISTLNQFIKNGTLPNLILFGSAGTGKTTLIKACATELFGEQSKMMSLEINASEERGIDIIRNNVSQFANRSHPMTFTNTSAKNQLIILDEADSMTFDAQLALKNVLDTYSYNTRFCLICNCIKKIHISLVSRCIKFRLHPLKPIQIMDRLRYISQQEHVNISNGAINGIVNYSHGDMRQAINVLQSIHTANQTKKIELSTITEYLNQISPLIINDILHHLITSSVEEMYDYINTILHNNNYSFQELLLNLSNMITQMLLSRDNTIFNESQLNSLLRHMGKLEYRMFSNVNTNILLSSLIGFVYLVREKIDY